VADERRGRRRESGKRWRQGSGQQSMEARRLGGWDKPIPNQNTEHRCFIGVRGGKNPRNDESWKRAGGKEKLKRSSPSFSLLSLAR
jgi:hypothetical protein